MGWIAVAAAVVGGVASYAQGRSAAKASKEQMQQQAAQERDNIKLQYQSEDWNRVQRIYEQQQGLQNYKQFSTLGYYAPDYQNKVRYNEAVAVVPRPY